MSLYSINKKEVSATIFSIIITTRNQTLQPAVIYESFPINSCASPSLFLNMPLDTFDRIL
jgi:hypothetical protein